MKWQIYGLVAALLVTMSALGLIVFTIDPATASSVVYSLLFVALFTVLWGVGTLVSIAIGRRLYKTIDSGIFYSSLMYGLGISLVFMGGLLLRKLL